MRLVQETGLDSRGSSPLGQRRSQAPPGLDSLRLLQVPFALMILSKQKSSRFSRKLFAGAVDKTKSESKLSASVTCFSMNFTRWSSENSQYTCQPHIMGEYNKLEFNFCSYKIYQWPYLQTLLCQLLRHHQYFP